MSIAFDEYDLIRSITKKDFYSFVIEFWDEVSTDPYIPNWHIKYICDAIQEEVELVLARKPKRYDYIIINVPPGSSKSTILMRMLNAWVWARDPSRNFIGASYERDLAVELAGDCRKLIKSEKYQRCFPYVVMRRDTDSKGTFGTTKGGKRYSTGTTGNITGRHGDIVVVDDPMNPRAARSAALTKSVNECITETLSSRKRQKHVTPTFIIMQRLAQDDPTGMLLDLEKANPDKIKIKHICLPATDSDLVKPASLRKFYTDGLLDPIRLSKEQLAKERVTLGPFAYAGQYDQTPIPLGNSMFMVEKLRVVAPPDPCNPRNWVKQVRYTDKAGTQDAGCYTASVRMGKTKDDRWFVLHVDRYQFEPMSRERRIKEVTMKDGMHVLQVFEQEPGSSGKTDVLSTIRNLAGYRAIADKVTGSKATRAESFAAQVNAEQVYLAPEGCIPGLPNAWHLAFTTELQFYPFGKYLDQGDAAGGAFNHLTTNVFKVGFLNRSRRRL